MAGKTGFRTDMRRAFSKIELAETYIEDGGLLSGARCLREAADLFEQAQMAPTIVFEQDWKLANLDREDGGMALVYEISDPVDPGLFVRLHSWSPEPGMPHAQFKQFEGKRLRVTVEVIE